MNEEARKASNDLAERFFDDCDSELFSPLAKKISDIAYDEINDKICDWLLSDTVSNLGIQVQRIVEEEIRRLLTGVPLETKYMTGSQARHTRNEIFKKFGDQLRNERIKDLEEEIERLRDCARFRNVGI